jgi:Predicted membrane protein (DUF2238)
VEPGAGAAFLGSQGDEWDAQKDMALAGLGALIAMSSIAAINWYLDPHFWREIKEGFRVKNQSPLGEVRLAELIAACRGDKGKVGEDPTDRTSEAWQWVIAGLSAGPRAGVRVPVCQLYTGGWHTRFYATTI